MIFNEVAPQTPKNKVDKTIMVLSKVRGCRQIVGSLFLFTHKLSSIEYYIVRRQEFLACLFKIFEGSEIYVYIGWIGHYCDKT